MMGGNCDFWTVKPGETDVISYIKGSGVVTNMLITTRCYEVQYLRNLVFEMYWYGSNKSSLRVPLGDLFGIDHVTGKNFISL